MLDQPPFANSRVFRDLGYCPEVDSLYDDMTGRALVRMLPLAYKVNAYAPDRAQIAVWSAGVFTIEGLTAPTEAWSTTTVDVVWSAGDWRLYSIASTPGPVPATPQAPVTPASQLLDSIDGFSSYRYVATS